MDEKRLRADSDAGMAMALQMVYGPWCDFRDPQKTVPFHFPSLTNYWLPTPLALSCSSVI